MVKRLPAMRETRVRFLGWEDPLEKEMAIHSSTLAWKIPWTEEPDRLQSWGRKQSDTTELLHFTLQLLTLASFTQHSFMLRIRSLLHFTAEFFHYIDIHSWLIHLLAEESVGRFQFSATAGKTIQVQVFEWTHVFIVLD